MVQAEQLNTHEKYKDAKYIYTRVLGLSKSMRLGYLTIELATKLFLLHEKTGNQSVAEVIQEFLLRARHYRISNEFNEDSFN